MSSIKPAPKLGPLYSFMSAMRPIALVLAVVSTSSAQQTAGRRPFELAPGVVLDPNRRVAYVMNPEKGVDAVELSRGAPAWRTNACAKPLALLGDLLLCQGEPPGDNSQLELVVLHAQRGGEHVLTRNIALPAAVRVTIDDSLTHSFITNARVSGSDVIVSWLYSVDPDRRRGIPDTVRTPQVLSGSFRMTLATGEISPVPPDKTPVPIVSRPTNLGPRERLRDIPGLQFRSADSLHVLAVQRVAKEPAWERFRWSIHDRATGRRIGEFRAHWSWAPFFVLDSLIVYQTPAYLRRLDQTLSEEKKKIRAADFASDQELWAWPVRDTVYRGPFPP